MKHFFSLLAEGATNGFFIPVRSEATLAALEAFGQVEVVDYIIAALGGALGAGASWVCGWLLWRLRRHVHWNISQEAHDKVRRKVLPYGYAVLLLTPVSLGGVLPLIAGFLMLNAVGVMAMVFVAKLAYYGLVVFYNGL